MNSPAQSHTYTLTHTHAHACCRCLSLSLSLSLSLPYDFRLPAHTSHVPVSIASSLRHTHSHTQIFPSSFSTLHLLHTHVCPLPIPFMQHASSLLCFSQYTVHSTQYRPAPAPPASTESNGVEEESHYERASETLCRGRENRERAALRTLSVCVRTYMRVCVCVCVSVCV